MTDAIAFDVVGAYGMTMTGACIGEWRLHRLWQQNALDKNKIIQRQENLIRQQGDLIEGRADLLIKQITVELTDHLSSNREGDHPDGGRGENVRADVKLGDLS